VELEKDDLERTVPRWANVLFVAAVVGVFGYFAQFAYRNETDRRATDRVGETRTRDEGEGGGAVRGAAGRTHETSPAPTKLTTRSRVSRRRRSRSWRRRRGRRRVISE
jgi:hypothetical protein